MAATVVLYEYTGTNAGTTTSSNKFSGSISLRAADMASETTPGSDPVVKGGSNVYSWERHLRMQCTATPVVSLTNPKFFTAAASWGTGVTPYIKTTTSGTGATPAHPSSTTGYDAASGWVTGTRKGLGTYTISNPSTGALGDYLIAMVEVTSAASTGTAGNETWTWAYDEA